MSVQDQLSHCRGAADRAGFEVVETYCDHASSGRTLLRSRPGILQMKDHIARGGVDALFVEGLERIGRRAADVVTTADWFEHRQVDLYSANAGRVDWKMVPFYAGIADIQAREIGEKTRRGQAGTTARGRVAAGVAYGYRVVHDKDLNREIDPQQAKVVRRVFEEYAAGLSPRAIAARLNAEGVLSPRGGQWNDSTIRGNAKKRDGMLRNEAYIGVIVYGRNQFTRDPDTGNRISRPADDDRIVHRERPELQIIGDDLWNEVQNRLEATYKRHAKAEPDRRSLNGAHRAKYLLARLITCDCCGAGYTIVGKERYGCYGRKTRGASACSNSKTISRFRLEERVVARLRQGLLTPELATHFAAEVQRFWQNEEAEARQQDQSLEADLAKVKKAIERLLDLLESDAGSDALLGRLRAKEEEARRLEAAIAARDAEALSTTSLDPGDLEAVYERLLRRLNSFLSAPEQVVLANELLGDLIAEIRVRPDEVARDGLAVEIHGDLARMVCAGSEYEKGAPQGALPYLSQISVVAGAGFEPATFRL
ncbi:recombinase family protein [Roseovarius salinarum]|uniref:recombinase family protein n=1 Tax=Roseovarius salinarum TaxID=1981892 RepID=UPI0038CDAD11